MLARTLGCLVVTLTLLGATASAAPPTGEDARVDLSVKDADIRDVLTFLAQEARINLVMTEAVKGKVTMYLDGVRIRHAMEVVLRVGGYVSVRRHGIVAVMTREEEARFW